MALCAQEEKTVAHLLAGAAFGELALMQVSKNHINGTLRSQHGLASQPMSVNAMVRVSLYIQASG